MDVVRVRTLGPVDLVVDGEVVELTGLRQRALLASLALKPGVIVSKDRLVEEVWDGRPPGDAANALRQAVGRLRQSLGAHKELLATQAPGWVLAVSDTHVDHLAFERALRTVTRLLADGEEPAALQHLNEGLALWRGDALGDVGAMAFALGQCTRLAELRAGARRLQAELLARVGAPEHGQAVLAELHTSRPLDELVVQQYARVTYTLGRQADATRILDSFRARLRSETGLLPSPETIELEQLILRHDPSLGGLPSRSRPSSPRPSLPAALSDPSVLVGRSQELGALRRAFQRCLTGRTSVVGITGDDGMGKTSLLSAFAVDVGSRAMVVAGTCREHWRAPLAPLQRMIDDPVAEPLAKLWGRMASRDGAPPELSGTTWFNRGTEVLRTVAATRPLIVVLEDCQWADAATVSFLHHQFEQLVRDPVLFVLSWRETEMGRDHPTSRLVAELPRWDADIIDLGPLSTEEIAEFIRRTMSSPSSWDVDELAERLSEVSGGVPLFVTELVAGLPDSGEATDDPDSPFALPASLRSLVARRLATVGSLATEVAEACAVVTRPIDPGLLCEILPDHAPDDLDDALARLVEVRLLDTRSDQPGRYTFRHGCLRRAVLESTPVGRRRNLHAAALRALEAADTPGRELDQRAELAHHAEAAGPLLPPRESVEHLLEVGERALTAGWYADAATFLRRALEHCDGPTEQRAPIAVAYAEAAWRAMDIPATKSAAGALLQREDAWRKTPELATEAAVLHAAFCATGAVDHTSLAFLGQGLHQVDRVDLAARLYNATVLHHALWGSPVSVASSALRDAESMMPDEPDDQVLSEHLMARSLVLLASPDLPQRLRTADELVALGHRTGVVRELGRGLRMRGLAAITAGDLALLHTTMDQLEVLGGGTGSWAYRSDCTRWRVMLALAAGDGVEARRQSERLAQLVGGPLVIANALIRSQTMMVEWGQGNLDVAMVMLEDLMTSRPPALDAPTRRLAAAWRVTLLWLTGREDEARAAAEGLAWREAVDLASCRLRPATLAVLARIAGYLELPDLAHAMAVELEPFRGQFLSMSWGEAICGLADGFIAEMRSITDGTLDEEGFQTAVAAETRIGARRPATLTTRAWERAARRVGAAGPR